MVIIATLYLIQWRRYILKTLSEKNRKDFIKTKLMLYGKKAEVHYMYMDLIQCPMRQQVRFVLTIIGNSHFILISSSRALDLSYSLSNLPFIGSFFALLHPFLYALTLGRTSGLLDGW
jgi:hypothetical protein